MNNISKSVGHLVRGHFLRAKNTEVNDSKSALSFTLAESGFMLRANLLHKLILNIQQQPVISTSDTITTDFHKRVRNAFSLLIKQNNVLNEKSIRWNETKNPFILLPVPGITNSEEVLIHVASQVSKVDPKQKDEKNKDMEQRKENYSIRVSNAKKEDINVSTILFYSLLPLQSERGKWTFVYQDLLRTRRKWWKRHFFNPSSVEVTETDARTDAPKASIAANFEGQNFDLSNNLTLESIRMLNKDEIPELMIETETQTGKSKSLTDKFKVVETRCNISNGCISLMLDSVRRRLFLDSTRLALDRDLAPYKVAICCADSLANDDEKLELNMLKSYLQQLLENENIKIFDYQSIKNEQQHKFFNDYEAADAFGVPYLIVLTSDSLKDGVVNIRDREVSSF